MRDLILGLVVGIANILPGISGGTIIFVSGKYSSVISAVADLVQLKTSKRELWMLTKLGVGALISIGALSKVLDSLYTDFPVETTSFFVGLVAGGLFFLWREIKFGFRASVAMGTGALSMIALSLLPKGQMSGTLWISIGGFIAGGTMVLPGVSGSSMLVILGIYDDAVKALSNLRMSILVPLGVGAMLGIVVVSISMKRLIERWKNETISFLYGLTLTGLFFAISSSISIWFLALGFLCMLVLEKIV